MSRIKKAGALGALSGVALLAVGAIGGSEGLRLKSYIPIPGDVPTVCYGETKGIRMGMSFTKPQCDAMLLARLDEFGSAIERCVPSLQLASEKRYVAHLSLAYNVGQGAYCKSTVARLQNAGRDLEACDAFAMWNKAGGRVVSGLTRRRSEERAMCRAG